MNEIKQKIIQILASVQEPDISEATPQEELIETYDEYEYEELYSELYILIRNIEDFYGDHSNPKAALLVESFLLEAMVLLKKDPEVIVVESGDFFVKSTSFTPDGEGVMHLFENVVIINSMIELYNQALSENTLEVMDIGIGMVTFPKEEFEHDHDHDHENCDGHCLTEESEYDYGIDLNNTAMKLALMANSDELDPIVINDMAYELLQDVDPNFFTEHLQKFVVESGELVVYHGNIVTEE